MITLIQGPWGVGKTSLLAKMAQDAAFDFERIKQAQNWLRGFYEQKGVNYDIPNHFVFSNIDMTFKRLGHYPRYAHLFDTESFGIQSLAPEGVECAFLTKYSHWVFDEIQETFPSDRELPPYKKQGINKHRHLEIEILGSTPRFMSVHKEIRANAVGIDILKRDVHIAEDKVLIYWDVNRIPPTYIDSYVEANLIERQKFAVREKIIEKEINVFNIYDAYSHAEDFYKGISVDKLKII